MTIKEAERLRAKLFKRWVGGFRDRFKREPLAIDVHLMTTVLRQRVTAEGKRDLTLVDAAMRRDPLRGRRLESHRCGNDKKQGPASL